MGYADFSWATKRVKAMETALAMSGDPGVFVKELLASKINDAAKKTFVKDYIDKHTVESSGKLIVFCDTLKTKLADAAKLGGQVSGILAASTLSPAAPAAKRRKAV